MLSHVTYVDRTQAFLLYTVDKIVASLIKQVGILFFFLPLYNGIRVWTWPCGVFIYFLPFRCKRLCPTTSARSCGSSLDATEVRYPSRDKIS